MALLSVNVNKIALIRNSRGGVDPDPYVFARIALDAGAHGITVHPRPDGRHIIHQDVMALAKLCQQNNTEFNMEGNPFAKPNKNYLGFMNLAEQARPQQCTLVPDSADQITSDHGFAPNQHNIANLKSVVRQLHDWGCRVSIFVDADEAVVDFASSVEADRIELYTGPYACATGAQQTQTLERYARIAKLAQSAQIGVNAGHDLNLHNLRPFVKAVSELQEVSIGHALITDALHTGMDGAVRAYLKCLA